MPRATRALDHALLLGALPDRCGSRGVSVVVPQSTFEEIVESERDLVLGAAERYGEYYTNARDCSVFISQCVTDIAHDRMMFGGFFALMKKHLLLAVLSTVRLHHIQAMLNLRYVLEAGAAAAFAIANPQLEHFAKTDTMGLLDASPALSKKRYKWLDENYTERSAVIRKLKEQINQMSAHANIVSSHKTYRVEEGSLTASTPFFDLEDDELVKVDLWRACSIGLPLVDLFYGVNQGRDVVSFIPNFALGVQQFARRTDALQAQLKETDRYKAALAKYGLPDQSA
jgi:hypothetical protein